MEPETFVAPLFRWGSVKGLYICMAASIAGVSARLVLTEQDFARAYVTEWATRFLLSLFRDYTVLFVGYSHDDNGHVYLARGLSKGYGKGRYALTPARENKSEHWSFLGITPIPYPQEQDCDHSALLETLEKWAWYTRMGALDHEQRIKGLLSGALLRWYLNTMITLRRP